MPSPKASSPPLVTRIYTLTDPVTDEVRYVGKTIFPLAERLSRHLAGCKRYDHHCQRWIRSLGKAGLRPLISLLETVTGDDWAERERFWIAEMRRRGAPLTNVSEGGEGTPGVPLSAETRAKIGESRSRLSPRVKTCCAHCGTEMQVVAHRMKHSLLFCGREHYSAYRAANAKRVKVGVHCFRGCHHTDEAKAKCAEAQRRMDPVKRSDRVRKGWIKRRGRDDLPGTITRPCGECGQPVTRNLSRLLKSRSGELFCTVSCSVRYQKKHENRTVTKPCGFCGRSVTRSAHHAARSKSGMLFCCKSHAGSYRGSAPAGT